MTKGLSHQHALPEVIKLLKANKLDEAAAYFNRVTQAMHEYIQNQLDSDK